MWKRDYRRMAGRAYRGEVQKFPRWVVAGVVLLGLAVVIAKVFGL